MSSRVSAHIRNNVVGYVAVFLALNGVAVAATLKENSVRSKQIKDGAIAPADLGDGAVTASKVAANSLGGAQIDESSLDPNVVQRRISGSCSPGELVRAIAADGTVVCAGAGGTPSGSAAGDLTGTYPAPAIAANAVDGAKVSDGSLTGADIGPNALGGAQIDESALSFPTSLPPSGSAAGAGSDLAGSYPAPQIAANAVNGAKVDDGSLTGADVGPNALGGAQIDESALALPTSLPPNGSAAGAGSDLAGSYPSPQIAPGAVTAAKLAPPTGYIAVPLGNTSNGSCSGSGWENVLQPVLNQASYYRDPYGTVHLQGAVLRCPPTSDLIFTLPAGYRPGRAEILIGWSSVGPVQVGVDSIGNVAAAIPDNQWVSLDAVNFSCFPHGVSGCP